MAEDHHSETSSLPQDIPAPVSCSLIKNYFPNSSVIPSNPQQHSLKEQKFSASCGRRQKLHWEKILKFKILTSLTNEPLKIQSELCRKVPWSHLETDLPKRHLSVFTTDSINYYRKEITNKLEKNLAKVFHSRNELGVHQQGFPTGRVCDIKYICAYIYYIYINKYIYLYTHI